ncbi:MAG: hypothetical protein ACRD32_03390 [Nitrososphaerales archaeon]
MKSLAWATLGAIFFPLAAYIYVCPKGQKRKGVALGLAVTAAGYGIGFAGGYFLGQFLGYVPAVAFLIWKIINVYVNQTSL